MYKQLLLILSLFLLVGCTQNTVNPQNELTPEKEFEIKIRACEVLLSNEDITNCKDNILLQQAIFLDDTTYCESSSNLKASELCNSLFYLDKAQEQKDTIFCGFITQPKIKEICLEI